MQQWVTESRLMRFRSLVAQTGQGLLIPFVALKFQIHEAPVLTPKCVGVSAHSPNDHIGGVLSGRGGASGEFAGRHGSRFPLTSAVSS